MEISVGRRIIITITVVLCSLLELIDTSIINVAVNDISGNLGATITESSWVISAYGIANVIIVPMAGWLSLKFGRKNYFGASVIIFTLASVLCGMSTNIWTLVFFRFVQGVGGGALLATSQTILVESYPKKLIGLANAMFGMGVILGPTLGPTLGGYIVDNLNWRWIFYVNLPVGIIAIFLVFAFIQNSEHEERAEKSSVDWLGIFLLILGIGSLQFVLEKGQEDDWFSSQTIILFSIAAVVGIIAFIVRQLTTKHPIVNIRILANRTLATGTALSFVLGFALFASVFIYPLLVQRFLGYTATITGLSLLPGALLSGLMMPFVGVALSKGLSPKFLVPVGFFLLFVFCYLCYTSITPVSGRDTFYWPLMFRGMGLGLLFVPLTNLALGDLKGNDIAQGAGITSMMRQLGGAFSVAICSTYVNIASQKHRVQLLQYLTPDNPLAQERINNTIRNYQSKGFAQNIATSMSYKAIDFSIYKQANYMAYMDTFLWLGVFCLICIPLIFIAKTTHSTGVTVAH
ncbi:MAG: DHA2 family efflux MFS transporter permease subunit [Chitinophagaceae bacterium]|nr:DHA2 family efflux MFS transporter permease subunit [Chitinophagaceae bacterium]